MIIKPRITCDLDIVESLSAAFQVISNLHRVSEETTLDLGDAQIALPSFVMPLALSFETGLKCDKFINSEKFQNILFPCGLRSEELRNVQLKAKLHEFSGKDYFPIVSFPSRQMYEDETSAVLNAIEAEVYAQLDSRYSNIIYGLRYIIGEIVDNVTQHSHSCNGLFYTLINRDFNYIEIAIADSGIGLLGSYQANNDTDILTPIEALQAANRGISTKNLPNAENRGFGLITSKRMIIEGLQGVYIMLSSNTMLLKSPSFYQYIELAPEVKFNGTIVIFRVPIVDKDFNYVNYIE